VTALVVAHQPDSTPHHPRDSVKIIQPNVPQWSPTLQSILDRPASSLPIYLWSAGFVFAIVFGAWSWLGMIDEVVKTSGKFKPQGEVVKVNPIELGRVARVNVKEGSAVRSGDVLFELDTERIDKEVERLDSIIQSNLSQKIQLQTMASQVLLEVQTKAAIAQTTIDAQQASIAQQKAVIANHRTSLTQLSTDAKAQSDRLKRLEYLVDEGAIAKDMLFQGESELRQRQRSMTEIQGSIQQGLGEINRLNVGMVQKRVEAKQSKLQAEAQIAQMQLQIGELQSKINENKVLLSTAQASRRSRFIHSPVSGQILTLNTKNQGEVIQVGQNVAEIAPKGIPLILSTILPSREAGFIKPGMKTNVKLDAYPYQDYGILTAKVVSVSLDSKPIEGLGEAYRLDVKLDRNFIMVRGKKMMLKSGQTATAEIITRHRRIIDVLLDPLNKLGGNVSL
jgi:hemolysin D